MAQNRPDSFASRSTLKVGQREVKLVRLQALQDAGVADLQLLPYSMRVMLENLLRHEDGVSVTRADIEAVARWDPKAAPQREIAFRPARVLLQDFTGVPAVVDLATMRQQVAEMGGDPARINPMQPVDLVVDHSVQVDRFGDSEAARWNSEMEFRRNEERYTLLRWGQQAFRGFQVVPPDTGIIHQINLEYLARVVFLNTDGMAYPDTLVGTDSHTTMINGLGVVGWGVGGIEAEAAMLGQPISMLLPQVIGFRLEGELPEGATATDLVLTVTQMLRRHSVVGKFVEYFGPGLSQLSLANRATLANMAPEYGATVGFFPVDSETVEYLRFSGRSPEQVDLVEAYCKEQGLWREEGAPDPHFTDTLTLDLGTVEPSLSGPKRPQDRVPLSGAKEAFQDSLVSSLGVSEDQRSASVAVSDNGNRYDLRHGSVIIAAITSCTNTSNPMVMVGAGLVAKKAVERGLKTRPWVKTSLAPGSKVVMDYLEEAKLVPYLEALRFHLVGYGCTTCIGNTGPLPEHVTRAVKEGDLVAVSVLSGNRNFEGRISPHVRANYLASPPLVVAYALAGRMDIDLQNEPLGQGSDGQPVYLRDIWPTQEEISETVRASLRSDMFTSRYASVFEGPQAWQALEVPEGDLFAWNEDSTYVRRPPFFDGMKEHPSALQDVRGAAVLAMLGDTVTTDHISPAGAIPVDGPAGRYLQEHGVAPEDFNSFGSRRGNHEVMLRGTFGNIRLRNLLAPGTEGNWTRHLPDGEQLSIYDASMKYQTEGVPLLVIAGSEYGTGSSRDWAAKGTLLLGVKAVMATSFERIHRSNLIGMGVLPLQFLPDESRETLGLTGEERYDLTGIASGLEPRSAVTVTARGAQGEKTFQVVARVDTPVELDYYRHGGILRYVLRQLMSDG